MLQNLVLVSLLGYAALCLIVYVFQSRLVYFPEIGRELTISPRAAGLAFEEVWLEAEGGVRLHGWYVPNAEANGVALLLHGNAGSIALRIDWLRMFHDLGYASLVIDYRGFGRSSGSPSEQGTYADARAAWSHLTAVRGWKATDIVLVGESLGGAVAAQLATSMPARALVLQSTFTSVPDLAAQIYWFLPVRWLSRFRYDTRENLARVAMPVLVAHSRDDEIVPYSHGLALYETAPAPKAFVEMRGGHNDAFLFSRGEWVEALGRFLASARRAW